VKRSRVSIFGGPEVLKLENAEDLRPDPQHVLIRVHAAGVNPYDTYARTGNYGARTPTASRERPIGVARSAADESCRSIPRWA
jgi:NADPH:quinone reductase-like Zn-dependent oxidoreductase